MLCRDLGAQPAGDLGPLCNRVHWEGWGQSMTLSIPKLFPLGCIKASLPKRCPTSNILQLVSAYGYKRPLCPLSLPPSPQLWDSG